MHLNGWQRLWVVVSALWLVCVAAIGFSAWPSAWRVTGGQVYSHMPEGSLRLLQDYKPDRRPLLASGPSGEFTAFPPDASDDQLRTFLGQHLARQVSSDKKELVSPAGVRLLFPGDSSADEIVSVLKTTGKLTEPDWFAANVPSAAPTVPPSTVLSSSHDYDGLGNPILAFWSGVSPQDRARVDHEYRVALDAVQWSKRAALIGWMMALGMVPVVGVYLLGWAAAWIRAGFSRRG